MMRTKQLYLCFWHLKCLFVLVQPSRGRLLLRNKGLDASTFGCMSAACGLFCYCLAYVIWWQQSGRKATSFGIARNLQQIGSTLTLVFHQCIFCMECKSFQ